MQVNPPPVHPLSSVDIGELLLETVKAAPVLPLCLMEAVASYVEWQSRPVRMAKPSSEMIADKLFGAGI